jgi:hypothetical protein
LAIEKVQNKEISIKVGLAKTFREELKVRAGVAARNSHR